MVPTKFHFLEGISKEILSLITLQITKTIAHHIQQYHKIVSISLQKPTFWKINKKFSEIKKNNSFSLLNIANLTKVTLIRPIRKKRKTICCTLKNPLGRQFSLEDHNIL